MAKHTEEVWGSSDNQNDTSRARRFEMPATAAPPASKGHDSTGTTDDVDPWASFQEDDYNDQNDQGNSTELVQQDTFSRSGERDTEVIDPEDIAPALPRTVAIPAAIVTSGPRLINWDKDESVSEVPIAVAPQPLAKAAPAPSPAQPEASDGTATITSQTNSKDAMNENAAGIANPTKTNSAEVFTDQVPPAPPTRTFGPPEGQSEEQRAAAKATAQQEANDRAAQAKIIADAAAEVRRVQDEADATEASRLQAEADAEARRLQAEAAAERERLNEIAREQERQRQAQLAEAARIAAELAEQERQVKLAERLARERANRLTTLRRAEVAEITAISVFTEDEVQSLGFVESLAGMTAKRAAAHLAAEGSMGNIDNLNLFNTDDASKLAGNTLLYHYLHRNVDAASEKTVQFIIDENGSRTIAPAKVSRFSIRQRDEGPKLTNDEAWAMLADSRKMLARECSELAHAEIFFNIAKITEDNVADIFGAAKAAKKDEMRQLIGTVTHRSPNHPGKMPMEHDFDELTEILNWQEGINYFKKSGNEYGIYDPINPVAGEKSAFDSIIEAAGGASRGDIMSVEGYGEGAFLALIRTGGFQKVGGNSGKGGYMALVHKPFIPNYSNENEGSKRDTKLNFRNGRSAPAAARQGVFVWSINVWHLTADGYSWAKGEISSGDWGYFADPRPTLRTNHRRAITDYKNRSTAVGLTRVHRDKINTGVDLVIDEIMGNDLETLEETGGYEGIARRGLEKLMQRQKLGIGEQSDAARPKSLEATARDATPAAPMSNVLRRGAGPMSGSSSYRAAIQAASNTSSNGNGRTPETGTTDKGYFSDKD